MKNKSQTPKTVREAPVNQLTPGDLADTKSAANVGQLLKKAPQGKFDLNLTPMLATLVDSPFDDPGWEFEVKWDGLSRAGFYECGSYITLIMLTTAICTLVQ